MEPCVPIREVFTKNAHLVYASDKNVLRDLKWLSADDEEKSENNEALCHLLAEAETSVDSQSAFDLRRRAAAELLHHDRILMIYNNSSAVYWDWGCSSAHTWAEI